MLFRESELQASAPARQLHVAFAHGLGDNVHFAHLLQLYKRRHFDVAVSYREDKALIWEAAGIRGLNSTPIAYTSWNYGPDFNDPRPECDWSGSKLGQL